MTTRLAPPAVRLALAAMAMLLACAPREGRPARAAMEQGRMYTSWLYGKEYGKLWERLTPEMRRVFGSAQELGAFAGKAVTRLGEERRTVGEAVADTRAERVYSRTSSFSSVPLPMVIQWALTEDGSVSGLVVRPAEDAVETGSEK